MCWTPAHTRQTQQKKTNKKTQKKEKRTTIKKKTQEKTTQHIIDSNHIKVQELIVSL
jgi:hypothetical protein